MENLGASVSSIIQKTVEVMDRTNNPLFILKRVAPESGSIPYSYVSAEISCDNALVKQIRVWFSLDVYSSQLDNESDIRVPVPSIFYNHE